MTDTNNPPPFDSDADYLDQVFELLTLRARRIGARRRLEEAPRLPGFDHRTVGQRESVEDGEVRRVRESLLASEKDCQDRLDARVRAHRADSSKEPLGIDVITQGAGLTDDERMVLLAITALAVSGEIGERITEGLGAGPFSRFEVESAILLLDPKCVADWLKARRYFHRSAPLVKHELVVVEYPSIHAGDLLQASVEVTGKAFAVVTGTLLEDDDPESPDTADSRR